MASSPDATTAPYACNAGSHFDAGFADTIDAIVGGRWFGTFFPDAHATGKALDGNASTDARLRWTSQSWLTWLYAQDCAPDAGLPCPDAASLAAFNESVQNQWITWHGAPFNAETALLTSGALTEAIRLTHRVDDLYGMPRKRVVSIRDVPFLTRAAIPQLVAAGINTVSVGVNGGSRPPNLPKAFVWRDEASGTSVRVLLLQGGYGGLHGIGPPAIANLFDVIVVPGLSTALVVDWAGDNSPPKTPTQLAADWGHLQTQFPGAAIVPGTFEDFAAAMDAMPGVEDGLPVITSEVGETWIFGAGADPVRTARMRGAFRALASCRAAGQCDSDKDPAVRNATGWMLRAAEHTDGLDHKSTITPREALHANYSNAEFHAIARGSPSADPALVGKYERLATSWVRQRDWSLNFALQALRPPGKPEHPLAADIAAEWAANEPHVPPQARGSPGNATWVPASAVGGLTWTLGGWRLRINASTGAICEATAANNARQWVNGTASPGRELAALEYMTLDWADFENYEAYFNYVSVANLLIGPTTGGVDFDDQVLYGIAAANATHKVVRPTLRGVWVVPSAREGAQATLQSQRAASPTASLVLDLVMPQPSVLQAGAFARIFVTVSAPASSATAAGAGAGAGAAGGAGLPLDISVQGFNKTSTRLPEALFLRFAPDRPAAAEQASKAAEASAVASGKAGLEAAMDALGGAQAHSRSRRLSPGARRAAASQARSDRHAAAARSADEQAAKGWCMCKLERWLSPWPIPWGGSTRLHAVSDDGIAYSPRLDDGGSVQPGAWAHGATVGAAITSQAVDQCAAAWPAGSAPSSGGTWLQIRSLDAAVASFGRPTPLPVSTTSPPAFGDGVSFILHNNAWATNYAAFIGKPMPAGGPQEDSFKWRFQIASHAAPDTAGQQ